MYRVYKNYESEYSTTFLSISLNFNLSLICTVTPPSVQHGDSQGVQGCMCPRVLETFKFSHCKFARS